MQSNIFLEIRHERIRQEDLKAQGKFRFTCADPELGVACSLAVLMEEVGEVAREALALYSIVREHGSLTAYRKELVQVAAVVVAMIEGVDAIIHRGHVTLSDDAPPSTK